MEQFGIEMIIFSHNDAWILYAIPPEAEDCPLSQILARADYVNHSIPRSDEIAAALTKGLRSGLLERSTSGVRYSAVHRDAIKGVTEKPKYAMDAWDALHKFLGEASWVSKNETEFLVSDADFKAALKQYLSRFRK